MIFNYKGKWYPNYLKEWNAIQHILPAAEYFFSKSNKILDIGGTDEWHYPGAECVNIDKKDGYHAMNLPPGEYDGIISSHCLEHLKNPEWAIERWTRQLKKGFPMILYLPHENMEYWAVDCPKHLHTFTPEQIEYYMKNAGFEKIIKTGQDTYWSFMVTGWKK